MVITQSQKNEVFLKLVPDFLKKEIRKINYEISNLVSSGQRLKMAADMVRDLGGDIEAMVGPGSLAFLDGIRLQRPGATETIDASVFEINGERNRDHMVSQIEFDILPIEYRQG